jgi:hypothetical protein
MSGMTADQYREALEALGLKPTEAARFLHIDERTGRRWTSGERDVPWVVAALLSVMIARRISAASVRRLMGEEEEEHGGR